MTSSSSQMDHDGSQRLPNGIRPAEQEVRDSSDLSPSPSRLVTTAAAAITPDSAERASSRSRPRINSVSSFGSTETGETGNSRLQELRSQKKAKLGALKERIKSSHTTLTTPVRNQDPASKVKPHEGNSQIGNSAETQNIDGDPTSKLSELRAKRKQRLEDAQIGSPASAPTPRHDFRRSAGSPPPVIMLSGTGVKVKETSPNQLEIVSDNHTGTLSDDGMCEGPSIAGNSDDMDMVSDSESVENDKANVAFRRLSNESSSVSDEILRPYLARRGSARSADMGTPIHRHIVARRSSARSVDDTSSLSKLDLLRLRRAQNREKAQLELAALGTPRHRVGVEQPSGESSAPKHSQQKRAKEPANNDELAKQLHDVQEERTQLKRQLEASRAAFRLTRELTTLQRQLGASRTALQLTREEKLSHAKIGAEAGSENDLFGLCNMVDELQGQVDKLGGKKIEDKIRLEEDLHKSRLEVAQLQEEVEENQHTLKRMKTENQELNDQKELQLENQLLRNGGLEGEKKMSSRIIRFWKPGISSSFGNPFRSLLGQRHRSTVKATGHTWHPFKPASYKSEVKSRHRFSNLLNGLVNWDTAKNVAWGAGIMGLFLMSGGDPQISHDRGPFVRFEIPTPLFQGP
ncbi:unnamed protein product [Cylindrotheca closterium]|uniref:Uncharacterized protein n=1 Tax=Cylindrotheca closterium TaxID=2856 RepID=A0AAD2FCK9_9STRA|nr:unnamed protein product [Cylindrotheca closterium]